ncbi:MAG: hypothetical protein GX410_04195, partial [Elusimicrobia bacterium]|nr:hypothetical protein [Elusimicrobiota bacterium]
MKTKRIYGILSALALTLCLAATAQARVQLPSTGKAAAQISAPSLTPTAVQPSPKKARPAQWTVMVYLNGNSNLAPDTLRIVDEMERIGSSADMQLVAHITRRGDQLREPAPYVQTESGLIVPSHQIIEPDDVTGGTYRYHVLKDKLDGSVSSMPLYAAGDPGSSATLLDFVKWAKAAYPARHYMLMIYGHGAGMMGTSASDEAGGGSSMTIPDLAFALRGAGGVDVLFFYSCLMQMAEVSARLDGAAKVILGSETSMLTGVPFESMFQAVHDNLSQDAQGVGAAIFSEVANNDTRLGGTDPVFALSVVKPSGIRKVIPALNAYVSAVMKAQDLDSALAARDNV